MNELHFEWDAAKAAINLKKHSISFEEACTVFEDPDALVIDDPEHSAQEERFIILGKSSRATAMLCRRDQPARFLRNPARRCRRFRVAE